MEILVVVGIIVLVLGLSVPAKSVWESQKVQDAINLTGSLLSRVQSTASIEHRAVGLLFYVEPQSGAQYVWPIEPRVLVDPNDPASARWTADRFVLRDVEPFKLPKPMRIVPASVLDESLPVHLQWTEEQLAGEELRDPPDAQLFLHTPNDGPGGDGTQYHRNFFVVLFDRSGTVADGRAFIVDLDIAAYPGSNVPTEECAGGDSGDSYAGFRTGLIVSGDSGPIEGLRNVVVDTKCAPIRFQSTESLLIYNDEEFRNRQDDHRRFLRQSAQPLYIHRATGQIIKGRAEGA